MKTKREIEAMLSRLESDNERIEQEIEQMGANARFSQEKYQNLRKLHVANQSKCKTLLWVLSPSQKQDFSELGTTA